MEEKNMESVAEAFKKLKFRKKLFGGVDVADVWKKLELIQKEYRAAYEMQEIKFQALLEERAREIAALKAGDSADE